MDFCSLGKLFKYSFYLREKWGYKVTSNFIEIVEFKLDSLSKQPFIGRLSKDGETRMLLITKHNKLYYQITENMIELLEIFDTRQNPVKNKFE